jgi:hypothetical protein
VMPIHGFREFMHDFNVKERSLALQTRRYLCRPLDASVLIRWS